MADSEDTQTSITSTNTITTPTPATDKDKICILLNATGNVPIIKKRTWTVDPNKTVSWIQKFIHKYLKLDASEQIFLYVNQTFAPAPDQIIKNLYDCHGTNGKLVLYYCKNQAWG
ncbi:autophagy protein 12-like [Drosophila willistoni]|uniref:autophagy protein 12-like n=1 Tax=Drosophila willistoni TaxID=7260 RepID=UPI00017D6C04|nr:autophagy protein 12-like [Drosophila willistoni]